MPNKLEKSGTRKEIRRFVEPSIYVGRDKAKDQMQNKKTRNKTKKKKKEEGVAAAADVRPTINLAL